MINLALIFLNLLKIFYFSISTLFLFFIPGRQILTLFKEKFSFLERFCFSLVIGIIFFTLSIYILGIFNLSYFYFLVFPLILIGLIKKPRGCSLSKIKLNDGLLWFLLIAGTITQNLSLFKSGLSNKSGDLVFTTDWAFHDFSWHLALIKELKRQVPPLNPIFKTQPLKDYHYFYDLLIAGFYQITKIPVLDLLYRFFPVLVSIILGLSVYLFVKRISRNETVAKISLFLTYFCGSFAYFIPLLKDRSQNWGESSFWVSQTFSMAIQPHFLISLAIIFVGLTLLYFWLESKDVKLTFLIALLFGSVVGFKAYAFLVIAGGLIALSGYQLIIKKDKKIVFLSFLTFLIFLLTFLPNSTERKSFFWSPLWFPKSMVASPDRLNMVDLILKEEHYLFVGNYLRFFQVKLHQLLLFIIGNLGIRFLGLLGIYFFFKSKAKKEMGVFLIGAVLIAFVFPLLFLQKGTVWNSIQTWYYLLIFMNIFTAIFVFKVIKLVPKSKIFKNLILILLLIFSLPTTVKIFINLNLKTNPIIINQSELEALRELKEISAERSLILSYPSSKNSNSSIISAISGRRVFYAHDGQAELFGVDFKKEKEKIKQIFSSEDRLLIKSFLIDNKIDYLFLWQDEEENLSGEFKENILLVFENEVAKIYKSKP